MTLKHLFLIAALVSAPVLLAAQKVIVDPATLTRIEIPRELYASGTVQQIREYVALYLEAQQTGTA